MRPAPHLAKWPREWPPYQSPSDCKNWHPRPQQQIAPCAARFHQMKPTPCPRCPNAVIQTSCRGLSGGLRMNRKSPRVKSAPQQPARPETAISTASVSDPPAPCVLLFPSSVFSWPRVSFLSFLPRRKHSHGLRGRVNPLPCQIAHHSDRFAADYAAGFGLNKQGPTHAI